MKYDVIIDGKRDKQNIRLNLFHRNTGIRDLATIIMYDLLIMNTTDAPKEVLEHTYDGIIKVADKMIAQIKQCKLVLRLEEEK